jgi:hypothetical protein
VKRFAAEVLFLNPNDVPRATEALAAVDCEFEINHQACDPYGPTMFGTLVGTTELDEDELGNWLLDTVRPLGGDVVEWGYGEPWKIAE